MAENLVIVESPGKVKSIGKFLGKGYKVEASMGHVRDLPKSQLGVEIENNFNPRYITIRGKGDIINRLKKEAKNAKRVYLATDPDREGEAISWHLAALLEIPGEKSCRVTFNEITKNAVVNAMKAPRPINMDLVNAQQARRVLDRIVGYKISPLLWKKVKKGLSAGRVQSVAARLVCDREDEIEKFVPEEYWTITASLAKGSARRAFTAKFHGTQKEKIELKNKDQVNKILRELEGVSYVVGKVKKSEKKKNPPPPFITSTLQQEAARKLGFTTKRTMFVAQQLYEGVDVAGLGTVGLITYMRTDSVRVSEEAAREAEALIKSMFGSDYLPETRRIYRNKSEAQDAHEAIRPSQVSLEPDAVKGSLTGEQYRLYKLIWERFVASQMASAVYDTVAADIEAGGYLFKANGSKVRFQGFMTLYTEGSDAEGEEAENPIPELEEGEELKLKKLEPKQHFTQPPQRYTEATLVKALEEKGIGRPSTYAPIISTILQRGYVVKEKKFLVPTQLGRIVTDLLKNYFEDIVDVEFTAHMESQLDEIEEGKKKWVEVIEEFYNKFQADLGAAEAEMEKVSLPEEVTDVKCEKCGRNMVVKTGRFGRFLACPGFPQCRFTRPIFEETGIKCPGCGSSVVIKKTKKGRRYYACENYPKCDFISWDRLLNETCPQCGSLLVEKFERGKRVISCSGKECGYQKT